MRPRRARHTCTPRFSFSFEQLPDEAQSSICSQASTPEQPGHVLLASVSKSWAAAVTRLLQVDEISIEKHLVCACGVTADWSSYVSAIGARQLDSLSTWLCTNRRAVTTLVINTLCTSSGAWKEASGWVDGVCSILQVLGAGQQPLGGLPLQRLCLPAVGGTPPTMIRRALAACPNLRELHLDARHEPQGIRLPKTYLEQVSKALAGLTRLTSLTLDLQLFRHSCDSWRTLELNEMCARLPCSLEEVQLVAYAGPLLRVYANLHVSSLAHLTALRQLSLADCVDVTRSYPGNAATELTALTYLQHHDRVQCSPLLAAPNLQELHAGHIHWRTLQEDLQPLSTLRTLSIEMYCCFTWEGERAEAVAALAQLTQLTSLDLLLRDGSVESEEDIWEPVDIFLDTWPDAVSQLTGLRCLAVEPELLRRIDFGPLTALSRLEVDLSRARINYTQRSMAALLKQLAPVRGQLQEVELVRARSSRESQWRAAVAAALGDVTLTFFKSWSN